METYGSRDKNPFQPGGKLGTTKYYLLVDKDGPNKGRITIKSPTVAGSVGGANADRTVGTIPLDNTFKPEQGSTTPDELEYFSTANAQKSVKNQGVITAQKGGISEQQARQLIFPNTATSSGTPPPAQDPSEDSQREEEKVNLEPQSLSVSIPEKASDKSDSNLNVNLRYPENMSDSQDNIIFGVKKLVGRKGINELSAGADFSLGENKYSNVLGTVVLPVQPSITDSNGVEWGGSTLNPIQAYAASMSMSMIDSPGGDITASAAEALNRAAKDFKTGLTDAGYKKAISLYFAQEAVGAQNLLSRTSGTILNPNLELLFNGPTLRPFNFTFRLSPRSESEAIIVKQIIKFFKTAMAVRRAKSEVFLKAPCIFNISYLTGVGLHQSLNQIKECALIGCDVDYTPDGTYMTFNDKDKTMTSYQLSLRFSELTPIYNTDYEDGHPIGY
jgi:hypothetical protein